MITSSLLLFVLAGLSCAQGVTKKIAPHEKAPAWCSSSYDGTFGIGVNRISGVVARDEHFVLPPYINHLPTKTVDERSQATTAMLNLRLDLSSQDYHESSAQTHHPSALASKSTLAVGRHPSPFIPSHMSLQLPPISQVTSTQSQVSARPLTTLKTAASIVPVYTNANGQIQAPASASPSPAIHNRAMNSREGAMNAQAAAEQSNVACKATSSLMMTLADGVLLDDRNQTGYVAGNYQLQLDDPPQSGAIYTAGFSVCRGDLTLGSSNVFWQCKAGGSYKVYDRLWADQCEPVNLRVLELVQC